MKLKSILVFVAAAALSTAAMAKDIVDIALSSPNHKTLVKLVTDAGLVDVLKGKGPFTVFAPTDAAFAKVPKATLEKLAKDKELLKKVLTYHVVAGDVRAAQALKLRGKSVATVNGAKIKLSGKGNNLMINNARVTAADLVASNGVIHVIDTVILPPAKK